MHKVGSKLRALKVRANDKLLKIGVAAFALGGPVAAFAQDPTYDPASDVAAIGKYAAAGVAISIAVTAAVIGIRSSKLPRRGA